MDFPLIQSQLIKLAQNDPKLELLWLYGSRAKGTAHDGSDIDLAVIFKEWIEDPIERRLRPELLALEWQNSLKLNEGGLSVLDMSHASIPIAMSVLTSGTLLVSKNITRQLQEQQRIMSKWEIDYLYHYQNQQVIYG